MIIRREQMRAFEQAAARGFEERMLARIREFFPKHARLVGEAQLRLLVKLALDKAQSHLLTTERNVALYLDLMCLLGSAFDSDPQMPWAADILADRSFPTQDAQADLLHERGWGFAQKISEDFKDLIEKNDSSRLIVALRDIGRFSLSELPTQAAPQLANQLSSNIKSALPVRCEAIGEDCLGLVLRRAFESAARYGIKNERGVSLFAALSLVVGAGFDNDPQLPWASRVLSEASTAADPISRTRRLHREAVECLRQWWDIGAGVEV